MFVTGYRVCLQLKACSKVQQEVTEMMQTLGLADKRDAQAHTLSGGMKRKLSVGIALIGNPQVIKSQPYLYCVDT